MVKLVFCARRRSDVSSDFFHDYWKNHHGPLFQRHAARFRAVRYVQNHTLPGPANEAMRASRGAAEPFDGVGEIWWTSLADFAAAVGQPDMDSLRKLFVEDEARFIDFSKSSVFFTEELEFPLQGS